MPIARNTVERSKFNKDAKPPFVDTRGAREQWMYVLVYAVDNDSEPAVDRAPVTFTEIYLGKVIIDDFRKNARGELGTRTATLHKDGIKKLRDSWIYRL